LASLCSSAVELHMQWPEKPGLTARRASLLTIAPRFSIKVETRKRTDGKQFEGPAVFFTSDGSVITVGVAKKIYDREPMEQLGSGSPGQSETLITRALQKALDAYFVQLDKYRSIGVLQTPRQPRRRQCPQRVRPTPKAPDNCGNSAEPGRNASAPAAGVAISARR
jgi:hypothetical protein